MQKRSIAIYLLFVLTTSTFASCSKRSPNLFWQDYKPSLITNQKVLDSTGGGYRWIHGESKSPHAFLENEINLWAADHGWRTLGSTAVDAKAVSEWRNATKDKLFPLFASNYKSYLTGYHGDIEPFPRHITGGVLVLQFDTNLYRENTAGFIPAYGYVLVNADGSRMAMYHLYGETPNEEAK